MFIREITISNFKGIKKFNLDFSPNKNGIENDIKFGKYKLIDDKTPIPGISSLIGKNSVGKTSIVSAIAFLSDVCLGIIGQQIVNKLIEKETNKDIAKNMDTNDIKSFQKMQNQRVNKRKKIVESVRAKEGIYMQKYSLMFQEWLMEYYEENANNKTDDIFLKISFLARNNKQGYISLNLNNEGKIDIIEKGDFKNKNIINFFKSSFLPKREYNFNEKNVFLQHENLFKPTSNYYDFYNQDINVVIANLIFFLSDDLVEKVIRLSDEEVDKIKYTASNQNPKSIKVFGVVLKNGSIINSRDLSSGTKKFIIIFEAIIRSIKLKDEQNSGLIVIDEIETHLHKELVQSILLLLRFAFHQKNIQSIITTHNIHFMEPEVSKKQIFSISKENENHVVKKASSFMKSHESLIKKYDQGWIAPYPDKELARNTIANIFDEI